MVAVDSAPDADRIRNYLETRGYAVDIASDAAHAIALAGTHLYRVLILDVDILFERAEAVRRLRLLRDPHLKLIAIAADSSLSTRVELNEIGINATLAKPIDLHALHQQLTRLLRKRTGR